MAITSVNLNTQRSPELAQLLLAALFHYGAHNATQFPRSSSLAFQAALARGVRYNTVGAVDVTANVGTPVFINLSADGGWNAINEGQGLGQIRCLPLEIINTQTKARVWGQYIPIRWLADNAMTLTTAFNAENIP